MLGCFVAGFLWGLPKCRRAVVALGENRGFTPRFNGGILVAMSDCVSESHVAELGKTLLDDFDLRLSVIPADMCAPFHNEANQLEKEVLTLYRLTVMCVRREPSMECVARRWGEMVSVCNQFIEKLKLLHQKHPACGADIYFDKVLDLANKCRRLQEMHG
jgi:hypothetical protein